MATKKKYKTDDDGNIIDPPIIPEFEARLTAAANAADDDAIAAAQKEYDAARKKLAGETTPAKRKAASK